MSHITITKDNFHDEVMNSDKTVLLDFWADWCGPCSMLSPVIEDISDTLSDVKVGKVNVDTESELSEEFGISSIPTLVVIKSGKVTDSLVGLQSKETILKMLK